MTSPSKSTGSYLPFQHAFTYNRCSTEWWDFPTLQAVHSHPRLGRISLLWPETWQSQELCQSLFLSDLCWRPTSWFHRLHRPGPELARRGQRHRDCGWFLSLLATKVGRAAGDWRAWRQTSANPRWVPSIPYGFKYGTTLFFCRTSDCRSFNLAACHRGTVNSGRIHKALSHIDPYGALFSRIGNTIDPDLFAAANILLGAPRHWSIGFS